MLQLSCSQGTDEASSALEDVVERLQAQLDAALAAREQEETELVASQRQTESAVSQLRDAQRRMDEVEASHTCRAIRRPLRVVHLATTPPTRQVSTSLLLAFPSSLNGLMPCLCI